MAVYNAEKFIDDSFNALLNVEIPENTTIEVIYLPLNLSL